MKKDLRFYIDKALKNKFCLGALNFSNMECLQGIVEGAKEANSPVIISVSEGALQYMTPDYCMALASVARKNSGVFLHLDHGKSFEICKLAVDLGFDSVMIDGSSLPFEENKALTKKVVTYAHKRGVLVEGELGQIKGIEDSVSAKESHYTNPALAKEFVQFTNLDLLAVAIGTSHGAYKYKGRKKLRLDILQEIEKQLPNFPLVLHGASMVDKNVVQKINKYGGHMESANGLSAQMLRLLATEHNIVKINADTDIRLATTAQVREILYKDGTIFDPREYLGKARQKIKEYTVKNMKEIYFSANMK